jgi:uncharacterized RDD family membrane protein YckC
MPKLDQVPGREEETNPDASVRQKFSETIKSRYRGLKKLWTPIGLILFILSAARSLYDFILNTGDLSYPVLGFALLSAISLLIVPNRSTRLFVFRILAFGFDLLFLAVITGASLFAYRRIYGEPSEFMLMGVVWLWFLYFVFYDWYFHGTPGKRFFGLNVISQQGQFDFVKAFLRTLLTIVVPVLLTWFGSTLAATESRSRWIAAMFLRDVAILLVPISILVFGGNRGLIDKILRTAVKSERGTDTYHQTINKRTWTKLCSLTLLFGFVLSGVDYFAIWKARFLNPFPTPNGKIAFSTRTVEDSETTAVLWAQLPKGLQNPAEIVQAIAVLEISRNPFVAKNTQMLIPTEIRQYLQQASSQVRIVRVVLISSASPAVYSLIMRNLSELLANGLVPNQPQVAVLQFGQTEDYGLFILTQSRNTVVYVTGTKELNVITFSDLNPPDNGISMDVDLIRWLLLGDGDIREAFKHSGLF